MQKSGMLETWSPYASHAFQRYEESACEISFLKERCLQIETRFKDLIMQTKCLMHSKTSVRTDVYCTGKRSMDRNLVQRFSYAN